MKNAYSYLRVSGKSQIEGDGFPRQRAKISEYALIQNVALIREFVEEGVSGTKNEFDRPALAALFEAVKHPVNGGGVSLVLVERADRLARDNMVSEILLDKFRKMGVTVIAAECGTDLTVSDDPTKKMFRQMLGIFAEYEKSCLVAKLRCARVRMKSQTGRCEGQKPYGALPGEQTIVDSIIMLRKKGLSFVRVADCLNTEGLKPRNGGVWHGTVVRRILNRSLAVKT